MTHVSPPSSAVFPTSPTSLQVPINKKERRLRCLGHIVNLVAKALLARANIEWQDGENNPGLIKRLHNVVYFIRRSPQRRDAFIRAMEFKQVPATEVTKFNAFLTTSDDPAPGLQLVPDNETRWNSTEVASDIEAIRTRYQGL
ncbi:hypothetical protein N657DRAFT_693496 [Parathielavia appendiculata]|uniref:Uncharacterized protein n=1 Tax=Parathielavia appendiculata TaxID=2587402 RepID=A0AAN6YZ87_9PEZI|nr:hypothetical protein N657DRAFT_693496 [Parathielavia appendiculata]